MAKKVIDDMLPKKSIRQIPISLEKRRRIEKERKVETEPREEDSRPVRARYSPGWQRKPLNPKFVIWFIAVICLLALIFGISMVFSSATITITPRTEKITFIKDSYTAKSDKVGTDGLSFEVLKVTQSVGETVAATEEKEVSQKATGKIIIYNNYSSSPQRLITNTRFEAGNGKIYRINSPVVVPGYKKVSGKITPGSIEATVFADQPGDSYNLKVADLEGDFTIPGFKGDIRYKGFYARIKTDILGGYVGMQRIVTDSVRELAKESLKIKLKEELLKELYAVKPESYIIFKDGYSISYTDQADTPVDDDKAKINMEGSIAGIVFDNAKLTNYIATKKISDFDGLPAELIPLESLVVTLKGEDMTSLWKNTTLTINLDGEAVVRWQYDADALRKDLAGKKEGDLKNIVAKYQKSMLGIQVIFTPIWTRYFPDDLNKIKIKEEGL